MSVSPLFRSIALSSTFMLLGYDRNYENVIANILPTTGPEREDNIND